MLRIKLLVGISQFLAISFGQKPTPNEFLLVDSVFLEKISLQDEQIVDSCLNIYHNSNLESVKLEAVSGIVELCSGISVWTSYNQWLFEYTSTNLEMENDVSRKRRLLLAQADAINNFGFYFQIYGELDSALIEYEKSLLIYEKAGDQIGSGNCLNNIGSIYYYRGDIYHAVRYYQRSLGKRILVGDQRGVANSLNNIGLIFQEEGDITNALSYYNKSLIIRERLGDPELISTQLNNIGLCYLILNENIEAEFYFNRSLEIDSKQNYQTGIAYSYFNLGRCFHNENSFGKALEKYHLSNEIFIREGNKIESGNCLAAIGQVYTESGQDKMAIEYLEKSLHIHLEVNFNDGICQAYEGLSKSYLNIGKLDLAKELAEKSLEIAVEIGYVNRIKNAAHTLFEINEKSGNIKAALANFQLFKVMSDSIIQEDAKKNFELNRAAITYEQKLTFQKKQSEQSIKYLEEKDASQQKTIYFIALFLIVIFALSTLLAFRLRRNFLQKKEIERQHSEKEILLKEIHHRVKNSLQITTSIIRLQKLSLSNEEAISALENSEARIAAIALVHKLLYLDTEIKSIDLNEYLKELLNNFGLNSQRFSLDLNCEAIQIETDVATPIAIVCSELISNSVKHAPSNSEEVINIRIDASIISNDEIKLCISDSGKGFTPDYEIENSNGLGFEIILALIDQIDGKIKRIRSNEGAEFEIQFKTHIRN
ncbi:MAG: hypothetical protein BM555_05310 [Crocinitomix sp. MedPE-SWsnd]|nr:MAG: hypothetical protein BM555_05310 [Crocinitomix sp. MedPE-SWsnd]